MTDQEAETEIRQLLWIGCTDAAESVLNDHYWEDRELYQLLRMTIKEY
jgi:hypothetical protein